MKVLVEMDLETYDVLLTFLFDDGRKTTIRTNIKKNEGLLKELSNNALAKKLARLVGIEVI